MQASYCEDLVVEVGFLSEERTLVYLEYNQWFFETGEPAKSLTQQPASEPQTEAAIQAITASLKAYGTVTLGPPPLPV